MAILVILLLTLNKLMLVVYPRLVHFFATDTFSIGGLAWITYDSQDLPQLSTKRFLDKVKKISYHGKAIRVSKGTLNSSKIRPSDFNFLTHIVKYRKKIIKNN